MKTLTGNVGSGNPFAAGGSTALTPVNMAGEVATTYKANFLGVEINFATEADFLKAQMAVQRRAGGGVQAMMAGDDSGGGLFGGSNFLPTMGNGLQTVGAFLAGRNLQGKVDDLDTALDDQAEARAELENLRSNATLAPLIGPLLKFLDSERSATQSAQAALEDQILAQDLQAGGGVANLIGTLTKGNGGGSLGGGSSGFGTAAALGLGGVGLGLMFSGRNNNSSSTRRSRR